MHDLAAFSDAPPSVGTSKLTMIAFITNVMPTATHIQPSFFCISHAAQLRSHVLYGTVQLASDATKTCPRVGSPSPTACGTHVVDSDGPTLHSGEALADDSVLLLFAVSALESISSTGLAQCRRAAMYTSTS
jgi:hypothetical protein